MEDCCAVCAEPLEWIGYGPCGHREVCFTCLARLRFVLNDKHCCICKQHCPAVYVTKNLGDYTRLVTDWESLLNHRNSSGQGSLWYDNVVEAYFDDEEPFKIIKAMCRLYCSICERAAEGEPVVRGMMKKGHTFNNTDTLRRHQSTVHKAFMCELCLQGRKVFISEQKLYSKSQLAQHSRRGDSEVDHGNEEERGGFSGRPMCGFCRKPFYGDNELYQHMSQEHFTCHICQRARPGHYEYYSNYDALEAHFRQKHLLCEHPECLVKKFVVFPSEAELKRHNATTHSGHMSRSERNFALQISVGFQYRQPGQDSRRGDGGQGGHPYSSNARNDRPGAAVRSSGEPANLKNAVRESQFISRSTDESVRMDSQGAVERPNSDHLEGATSQVQGDVDNKAPRYIAAVWSARPSSLSDAAFPPLPGTSKSDLRRAKLRSQGPASVAARLGGNGSLGRTRAGTVRVLNATENRSSPGPSLGSEIAQAYRGLTSTNRNDSFRQAHAQTEVIQSLPVAIQGDNGGEALSIRNGIPSGETGVAGNQQSSKFMNLSNEEIRAANKALVERIRAGLEGNEQRFADFKGVSSSYPKAEISSKDYYVHIARLGLMHVVPELARLCPDPTKEKELMDLHSAQHANNVPDTRSVLSTLAGSFSSPSSFAMAPIGSVSGSDSRSKATESSSDSNLTARSQVNFGTSPREHDKDSDVEVLSTNGYRWQKGKSKMTDSGGNSYAVRVGEGNILNDNKPQVLLRGFPPLLAESSNTQVPEKPLATLESGWACGCSTQVNTEGSSLCASCGANKTDEDPKGGVDSSVGSERKKKMTPKFQRVRLGDALASLSLLHSSPWGRTEVENESKKSNRSQSRGVWNNGGGQRIVSFRDAMKRDA